MPHAVSPSEDSVKQGENFSEQEWAALSPEHQDEALRIEQSVRDFLADSRTIRYVVNDANGDALQNFLSTHGLDVTHRNLLFAFDSLQGELELVPFAAPIMVEEQPPAALAQVQPAAPSVPVVPTRPGMVAWKNGRQII